MLAAHNQAELDRIKAEAKEKAREFLHNQVAHKQEHGAGWDERRLTYLMVLFWKRGREEAQKDPVEYTPPGD